MKSLFSEPLEIADEHFISLIDATTIHVGIWQQHSALTINQPHTRFIFFGTQLKNLIVVLEKAT